MAIENNADFTPTIPDSGVTPTKLPYNPTGSFKFWAQKVLPLVYDDSLSYYEVLCKVVAYLNSVIQNVDNLNDSVNSTNQSFETLKEYVNTTKDTLISTYNELQGYVNTYFDNLNVQEEINAKLDAMADSGELTTLLAPFIPDLVTQWLNTHVTPTSPIIDKTLSISGAGADAKVTGDAIRSAYSLSVGYRSGIPDNTDYDTLLTPGNYYVGTATNAATMINCPTSLQHIMYILTTINANRVIQIVQESSLASNAYKRYYNGTTWTAWKQLLTDADISPQTITALGERISSAETDIIDLKEDLTDTQDIVIAKEAEIDIGELVVGSTVNSVSGGNNNVNYGTRTNYVDFNIPVLIRFSFDLNTYQYDIFTYSSHAIANVVDNPTNAKWANNERIFVFVPSGTAPCFRIGIMRKDMQEMTTDPADPTSDFYKIKNGIKIYRITDTGLNTPGVPADSKAVSDAIQAAKAISYALSFDNRSGIPDNTDYNTVVTAGNYYVGTGTNASTMAHCPTNLAHIMFVLTTINANRIIQIVQESSLATKIYMRYYNGSIWTEWNSPYSDENAIQLVKTISYALSVDLRSGIPDNTDYDTLLTPGNYYVGTATNAATMINCPTSLQHIMYVLTTINANRVIQIVQESSLTSHIYKRSYNGSTWTSWTRLITDQDVDVNRLNAHMEDSNILSALETGTTTTNGITVKSDGNGTYKISGTATANTVYNIYNNQTAFPSRFRRGETYRVKVDIPSVYTRFRVSYYVGGEGTTVFDSTYDGAFTIPSNAEGLAIRFFFFSNTLNSPEFEVHPQIFADDSIGYIESNDKKSFYPPMLTIIDDDGYGYFHRDIMPLCVAKNASISSAVVTGYMGVRDGYMTWEQVQECYSAGCEILSHGYNHETDADIIEDGTTAEELEMWYRKAKHDLQLHGIKSDILVFNNNTANVIQCQQAARRVYKGAIHAAGYEINGTTANPYYIKRFNFTAPSQGEPHTLQEMKDNIDSLVSVGTGWDVWMIHTSSTGGWSADEVTKLGEVIDYARSKGVQVVTCEYAMRYYYNIV